eukprot:UN26414
MTLPNDALDSKTNCPHDLTEGTYFRWEDSTLQWPNRNSNGPPQPDGSDIILPGDTILLISETSLIRTGDTDIYGRIFIPETSKLIFDDPDEDGTGIVLHTLGIDVSGELIAGSSSCRLDGKITITLHGEYGNTDSTSDFHLKSSSVVTFININCSALT